MRRLAAAVALLVIVIGGAVAVLNHRDVSPGLAPVLAGAPTSATVLARGEYLTKAADCIACHTVPESHQPYAGGLAFRLPFGTIYSSNITADVDTGIGSWSDDDFVRAVREGVDQHGQHLYPAFPYTSYTLLSRDDVLAIKAYLFSLPAIHAANRANELPFPFNQRWTMNFWNAAFFKSERFEADPAKPADWNSGHYLASALGHCAECHTPRNLGFGLKHHQEFAGEVLQGWHAYNITADTKYGIGGWSDGAVLQYLTTGHTDGHASASGSMGEAIEHSLQYLDPADASALVVYLRSVPAREGKDPITVDANPAPASAASAAAPGVHATGPQVQGEKLFEGACASCHQWNGNGQQSPYASLLGTRGVNDPSGTNVTQAILQGANLHIGDSNIFMPAFAQAYSDTEVAALANYVIAQFGGKQGNVTPADVAKRRGM